MARVSADNVFRKVKIRMWRSGSFSRLSPIQPSGQALWLYLLTCPESSPLPGAIVSGRAAMAEALGWEVKAFDKAFAEASVEGMAKADWKARLVWLPRGPYENPPANPNVLKSWGGHFRMLPDSPLKTLIFRELKAFAKGLGKPFTEAFAEAFGKGGAHQEQEQEQEQEIETEARNDDGGPELGSEPSPPADDPSETDPSPEEPEEPAGEVGGEYDDTGAPLTLDPNLRPEGLVCWVPLKREGLFVGVTRARLMALGRDYPLVDVQREFTRPGGIKAWNEDAARGERKRPGKRGFWAHVHQWLDKEQKREHRALKTRATQPGVVPGTQCGCGKPKAEGAACCSGCAELYAGYARDSLTRERRPEEVTHAT